MTHTRQGDDSEDNDMTMPLMEDDDHNDDDDD